MLNLLYLFPLASVKTAHMLKMDNQEQVIRLYTELRNNVLGMSDTFVSLALVLAGFFVGIKLIRLSYDTMSDEQGSGLGGVKLSQIIGPVVIIALISGYKFVIGGLDYAVGIVVNKIADTSVLAERMEKNLSEIKITMDQIDDEFDKAALEMTNHFDTLRTRISNASNVTFQGSAGATSASINADRTYGIKSEFKEGGKYYQYRYDEQGNDQWQAIRKFFIQYGKTVSRSEQESKGSHGVISDIAGLLFNVVYLVMIGLANIFLCLLALLGPFVLAFSLFEPWKNSFITFIGKYIEVSLWMIVAKIILWLTNAAGTAITTEVLNDYHYLLGDILRDGASSIDGYYAFGRTMTAINIIRIAGILALMSLPDITSSIFSLGSGGAMGGAAASGTKAVETAANAPGKLAGGIGKIVMHRNGL